jgi:hypothetical protein
MPNETEQQAAFGSFARFMQARFFGLVAVIERPTDGQHFQMASAGSGIYRSPAIRSRRVSRPQILMELLRVKLLRRRFPGAFNDFLDDHDDLLRHFVASGTGLRHAAMI